MWLCTKACTHRTHQITVQITQISFTCTYKLPGNGLQDLNDLHKFPQYGIHITVALVVLSCMYIPGCALDNDLYELYTVLRNDL